MNLNELIMHSVIQDDSFQCISDGIVKATKEPIILVTIRQPEALGSATRHTIKSNLHNLIDLFEYKGQLFILLKQHKGISLSTYLENTSLTYDQRIYLGFEMLKVLVKYDAFSDNIKYQLVAMAQWQIVDDVLMLRELLHFGDDGIYTIKHILSQVGLVLEKILQTKSEAQNQFVDNLILGNHPFKDMTSLLKNYKDIFIYEKEEAINAIPYEYNLVFSSTEPLMQNVSKSDTVLENNKPPHVVVEPQPTEETQDAIDDLALEAVVYEGNGEHEYAFDSHETATEQVASVAVSLPNLEAQGEIETLTEPHTDGDVTTEMNLEAESTLEPEPDAEPEATLEPELEAEPESALKPELEAEAEATLEPEFALEPELEAEAEATLEPELDAEPEATLEPELEAEPESILEPEFALEPELEIPQSNDTQLAYEPKIYKDQLPDFCDLDALNDPFDENYQENELEIPERRGNLKLIIFPILMTLIFVMAIVFGIKTLFFKPNILEASYRVENLSDNRVAFINTSACSKKIEACEWTVYYNNQLVQSFITDNLYPVFDTEGNYTIALRIQDSDGNWSNVYSEVYPYQAISQ